MLPLDHLDFGGSPVDKTLSLSASNLPSVPSFVSLMPHLETLDLSENAITEIAFVPELERLAVLNVTGNQLDSSAIVALEQTGIKQLYIGHNLVRKLHPSSTTFIALLSHLDVCTYARKLPIKIAIARLTRLPVFSF